jgi:hypothetical protein
MAYLTMFRALYISRIWFAIYKESAIFNYVRASRLLLGRHLLEDLLREEDELLVVGGALLALDLRLGRTSGKGEKKRYTRAFGLLLLVHPRTLSLLTW